MLSTNHRAILSRSIVGELGELGELPGELPGELGDEGTAPWRRWSV